MIVKGLVYAVHVKAQAMALLIHMPEGHALAHDM